MTRSASIGRRLRVRRQETAPPLLLTVAVGPDAAAIRAWEEWRRGGGDIETLDRDVHPVLPSLHRRLFDLGIEDVDLPRLRGIHRQCWARNQHQLSGFRNDLEVLANGSIPAMVGTRIALVVADERDVGATYFGVPSCIVPAPFAAAALSHLVDHGFSLSVPGTVNSIVATRRSTRLARLDEPEHVIELVWPQDRHEERGPWSRSRSCAIGTVDALAPSTEDVMVAALANIRRGQTGWVVSVLDAMFLLARSGTALDWSVIVNEGQRRHLSTALTVGLRCLRDDLGAPVPTSVFRELQAATGTRLERVIYTARGRQAPGTDHAVPVFEDWLRVRSMSEGRWMDPNPWRFAAGRMGARSNRDAVRRMVGNVTHPPSAATSARSGWPRRTISPRGAANRIRALRGLCGALVGLEVVEPDWNDVTFLAREFGLEPALWSRLQRSGRDRELPQAASAKLREAYRHNTASLMWRTRQLKDVVRILNQLDIEPLLIKGSRSLLEKPRQKVLERYMLDLDLVVPTPQFEAAIDALRQHGYRAAPGRGKAATYEWTVNKTPEPGPIDFHFELGPSRVTGVLPTGLAFRESQHRDVDGCRYTVLSPAHELVHAVLHSELGDRAMADKEIDPRRLLSITDLLEEHEGPDAWAGACGYLQARGRSDCAGAVAGLLGELFGFALEEPPSTQWARREVRERLVVFALPNLLLRRREVRGAFAAPYMNARYPDLSPQRARLRHAVTLTGRALRGERE